MMINKNSLLIVWPKTTTTIHVNYHYTYFGEIVGYLKAKYNDLIYSFDCDFQCTDLLEFFNKFMELYKLGVKTVALCTIFENYKSSIMLARKLKEFDTNIRIIVYGNIVKLFPTIFYKQFIDSIYSEGDFETCIENFWLKQDMELCTGVIVRKNNEFIYTNQGTFITDSDWGISEISDLPVRNYCNYKNKERYVINVSRGCPFNCRHCLIPMIEGSIERRRSIDNLRKNLLKVTKYYKHIKIWAANFTLNKKYVEDFCRLMTKEFPNITWECATRIDLLYDEKFINYK